MQPRQSLPRQPPLPHHPCTTHASLAELANQRLQVFGDKDEVGAAEPDLAEYDGQLDGPPTAAAKGMHG